MIDWSQNPVQLPTIPGELEATEARVESIVKKIDELPLKAIGNDLRKDLANLNVTLNTATGALQSARGAMVSAHGALDNANHFVEPNSVQSQELDGALQEVTRAARSIRVLADYLERHPDALIRGKTGEAK